jgi:hypothetical protein
MSGSNPLEIIGNDPSVKIIRAAVKYFKEPSHALAFEAITRIGSRQSASLSQFPNRYIGSMETARHMANALSEAVNHEEALRSQLKKELGYSNESSPTPDRSFTNHEMKYLGETAAKLGDAALLDKYYNLVENDPDLARQVVLTQDRIATDALISQARAANICTQAIEKITFTEDGGMEVVIDPARFIEAKDQLETSDIAFGFRSRMIGDEAIPKLTIEDTEYLSKLTAPLYVQPAISDYINRQYIEAGEQAARSMEPPLSEKEKAVLEQLILPSAALESFEHNHQAERASDEAYRYAKASQNDVVLAPARNFTIINPSDIRDKEETNLWKNDRITREAQGDFECVRSVSDEESRLPSEIEPEEDEMTNDGGTIDIGQAGLSQ